MNTPYQAAKANVGNDVTARIERFRLDGGRCGLVQGRHAAWNWAYRVHVPGQEHSMWNDRGLEQARTVAACFAATIVEDWPGGKRFTRGPSGGLKGAPCPALFFCQECGHKFRSLQAAERASFGPEGCPECGSSDIDDTAPAPKSGVNAVYGVRS